MDVKQVIERINDDIVEVVGNFIELKRNGRLYKACCPFHGEKTPSFTVTPERNMFKCFGCSEGGDAIRFIEKHEGVDFKEAVEIGAKKLHLDFSWHNAKPFNQEEYNHHQSLKIVSSKAAEFFRENLKNDKAALAYFTSRGFEYSDDDTFMTGYAPDGNVLLKWATKNGIKKNLLIEAGLVKSDNGREWDFFRNRLMFPICNKSGEVIAFTGRTLETDAEKLKKTPKYLNTPDTPIFTKGNELYALNLARPSIRKYDRAYLVEGNTDVKRLHETRVFNTITPCGTALTVEQALLLKTYTNKVTLIYDGDDAGRKAIRKNAEILIKQQFHVSVILLNDGDDPDSVFVETEREIEVETFDEKAQKKVKGKGFETVPAEKIFEEYNETAEDYIVFKIKQEEKKTRNPVYKSELIKDTAALISYYDDPSKQEVYVEFVSGIIKPKKAWQDALKTFVAEKAPVIEKKSRIPKISMEDYMEWGFYSDKNCLWFRGRKDDPEKKSNFTMSPLFHIESTVNAKRLYELKNMHGITRVLEVPQKDLVSLSAFRVRIESLGNFLWTGSEADLNVLKAWLYEKTQSCKEIAQMGWQKEGFFAWGNGIYNGKFTEVDKYGIARHGENNYYIPAKSSIYQQEENLFEFERKFIHMEGNITLREYVKKFTRVFGDNGKIAICFYMASLFRDVVVRRFEKFPVMNLFGPKGAGKNACAEALLHFFGLRPKVPNLHNTSKAALADHVATTANAICVLDEYRNDLEMEKREFLKGLWDGTGRTRMNMDKDKKKETTSVDQGVIVCGQQMATADIALFSRFIVLSFTQTEYSDTEKRNFEELEEINKRGLTHITHQVLKHRQYFSDNYKQKVNECADDFRKELGDTVVETRIFNNWLCVLAAYATLEEELELPWDYTETIHLAVKLMLTQNAETKKNDDLGSFWKAVQFLISSNILLEGGDYKTAFTDKVTWRKGIQTKDKEQVKWLEGKNVFWLNMQRVFNLYKRQVLGEGDKPLPESTVEYYLKNSKAFLFETKKESFKKIDPKTGLQEVRDDKKMRTSTTALVFDMDLLNLNVAIDDEDEVKDIKVVEDTEPKADTDTTDMPF
ncbi:DNA primase [Prolixibacteraceae bacterium Z1-6]|uniref:DNA primase n=1 Tax=Draconibacterium aestuarii TaxID=2998507 RepID=A0A9X3J493_9BACT|nr:DNA primase [Prolixibacteraceae bacterium Z1-6]